MEFDRPDNYKIKRWEEPLTLVKLRHEQAHQRWRAVEEKTMKDLAAFLELLAS